MTERALLAYLAGTRPAASPRTSTIICHVGVFVIAIGVFLAPYAEWRIADVFITASDGLFALGGRSEEHTSELQSLMRISYAVFCWKKKNNQRSTTNTVNT